MTNDKVNSNILEISKNIDSAIQNLITLNDEIKNRTKSTDAENEVYSQKLYEITGILGYCSIMMKYVGKNFQTSPDETN